MSKLRLIPYAVMTAGGMLAAGGAADAQSMYDVNRIQDYQQDRIERGIYDGQITRSEAGRLEQGERTIDRAQRRAEADGWVSPQERARIDYATGREGREIYQQSHDRQQAWDRSQDWGRTDGRPYNGWNDRDGWGRDGRGQTMSQINQRQDFQQNRIERGIYDGQISRSEAQRLEQGERAIDNVQRRAEADGRVSPQERARIDRMTDREGREIYQQSHDRQQAWDRNQDWGRTDGRPHNGWNDRDGGRDRDGWRHADWDNRGWNRNGGWDRGGANPGGSNTGGPGWGNGGGWNHGGNGGPGTPPVSGGGTGTTAGNGGWGNGGWNHGGSGGTGTGTPPAWGNGTGTTAGNGGGWGSGGWGRGGTGATTPTPAQGGAAVANSAGARTWGNWSAAQPRPAMAMGGTGGAPRTMAASAGGGHAFGGGGRR